MLSSGCDGRYAAVSGGRISGGIDEELTAGDGGAEEEVERGLGACIGFSGPCRRIRGDLARERIGVGRF